MKRILGDIFPVCCLLLVMNCLACAQLPRLRPMERVSFGPTIRQCLGFYQKKPFRVIHRIEATLPMQQQSSMLGITIADPDQRWIRSVLLSVEGVTLFDATSWDGKLEIHRAIGPLDKEGFAKGLLDDVAMLMLAPQGLLTDVGRAEDGQVTCRFQSPSGEWLDVAPKSARSVSIRRYDRLQRLQREVRAQDWQDPGVFGKTLLSAPGALGYTLRLELVQGESIEAGEELFQD